MRLLWKKPPAAQLDLLDVKLDASLQTTSASDGRAATASLAHESPAPVANTPVVPTGLPLLVPIASIDEDPNNLRTEFGCAARDQLLNLFSSVDRLQFGANADLARVCDCGFKTLD